MEVVISNFGVNSSVADRGYSRRLRPGPANQARTGRRWRRQRPPQQGRLDARTEHVVEGSAHGRRETVSFRAAYGNERVVAHVFLPRDASPPYQVVIVFGGTTIINLLRRVEDFDYPFEFTVRSGRAVVIPALSGTLERGPSPASLPPSQERDRALRWSSDIGRTLEYLDARADIDKQRLACTP